MRSWSRSQKKQQQQQQQQQQNFFDVDIVGKKIESGLAWYVLLYTMVCVITGVKICCGLIRQRLVSPQHFDHCDDA